VTARVLPVNLEAADVAAELGGPLGLLPAAFLTRVWDGLVPDRTVPLGVANLLEVVDRYAPPSYRHGTVTGRVVEDPCTAGDWHRDAGTVGPDGALRFAVTVAADPELRCGHEFRALEGAPMPSGIVVRFTDDEHRRPEVPVAVRRVFLSVALYRDGVAPDLSCVGLEALRGAS